MTEQSQPLIANLAATGDDHETTSKGKALSSVISTRSPTGLLDLPPELRLMIYRLLLVRPHDLNPEIWASGPQPSVGLLRTNRLLHREAFHVLYGENKFENYLQSPHDSLARFPRLINTIRNLRVSIPLYLGNPGIEKFSKYMHHFGNSSIIRGTLSVDIDFGSTNPPFSDSLIQALGRCNRFKNIELQIDQDGTLNHTLDTLEDLKNALESVLGDADNFNREERMLRFHPIHR